MRSISRDTHTGTQGYRPCPAPPRRVQIQSREGSWEAAASPSLDPLGAESQLLTRLTQVPAGAGEESRK